MTVGGISSNGGGQLIDTSSHDFVADIGERLAVLMLETQEASKEADRQMLSEARRDFVDALDEEVQALKDQADAQFRGAMVSAGLAVAGGALAAWDATLDCERSWQGATSQGLFRSAQPIGEAVGNNYGSADARSAQGAGQLAQVDMDAARSNLDDADQLQDKALDWASQVATSEAATANAILSNMA